MLFCRKNFPFNIYTLVVLVLFSICLYITFFDKQFKGPTSATLPEIRIPEIKLSDINLSLSQSPPKNSSVLYLRTRLDLTTTTALCQKNDYLIIYVLSTVTNIQRRKVIRSTWGSKQDGVCFVFILGQVPGRAIAPGQLQMEIRSEMRIHQDIVQIQHLESYANVIYKEMAALQWSYNFYPNIPFLFKTDDDLIVDTLTVSSIAKILLTNLTEPDSFLSRYRPNLVKALYAADRATFFRGGWAMDYQPTLRAGKFGVSEKVWPHAVLPAYCSGFGWFLSKPIRDQLAITSYSYPKDQTAWIGDVFVSGFLAKAAKVKCTGIEIDFDQTASANCSCLMANNPLLTVCSSSFHLGGGGTEAQRYEEYQKSWKVIQSRHNFTNNTFEIC